MAFPSTRLRRLRKNENIRKLVHSTALTTDDLLFPTFVKEGGGKSEIQSMPGQYCYPLRGLGEVVKRCEVAGIPGLLIFGLPEGKDEIGSEAFSEKGVVQKAVRMIRENSELAVFTDVCLCQYTSHGHCGVLDEKGINNEKTLEILGKIALSHAQAGADFVAPSSMMDGQVKVIRNVLDENGFNDVGIVSYSAKFASAFYSPFRDVVKSTPKKVRGLPYLPDRRTYQVDFRSRKQAMREISLDVQEGADIVMVKPALPYLDILHEAKQRFDVPIAAFQVSGEYAIVKLAAKQGFLNEKDALLETVTSIKRAGADFIITYAALDIARWLSEA